MKRVISFFLCLVMCFSLFSGTAVQVSAHGSASMLFTVKKDIVTDEKITFTVSLSGGVESFGGAVVLVEYDNNVLAPVEFSPAYESLGVQKFNGIYTGGKVAGSDNLYSVAYTNTMNEKVAENKEFFNITFEIIGEERPETDVTFFCKEFYSVKNPEQSITVADGLQKIDCLEAISTLAAPKLQSATIFTNGITVKWRKAVGATGYEIFRKTAASEVYESVGTVSADNTEFKDFDSNLESGNTYVYSVAAVNEWGSSSYDTKGVSCKYVSKPSNITAQNGIGGIDVSWDKANGADKYQVLRRDSGTEEWTIIAEPSNSKTSYKDVNVESGKTYEYDVNSVLGSFITDTASEAEAITYLTSPSDVSVANIIEDRKSVV